MRTDLPIEAVSINGSFIEDVIDGYMTVTTTGRETLTPTIETYNVGSADGETVKHSRAPAREITVEFTIQGKSLTDLRLKLNRLNNILSSDEADFMFNDEAEDNYSVFYTGIPLMQESITKYKNGLKGEYIIYCAYPFKRSTAVIEATPVTVGEHSAQFVINYNGTYPARPVLQAEFAGALAGGDYSDDGDCGYICFVDSDENIIQLGNPDAIDLDAYSQAEQLINREFTTISEFSTSGGKTFDNEIISGSVVANQDIMDKYWNKGKGQTLKFAKPTYGTDAAHWHGPIMWKQLRPAGAVDWDLSAVHRMCCNNTEQCGTFELGAYNVAGSTLTMVAGILITKNGSGTTGKVQYIVNGKTVKSENIDLSYYNTNFGYCNRTEIKQTQYYNKKKKKWQTTKVKGAKVRKVTSGYKYTQSNLNTYITKMGNTVTFKVGNLAAYTYSGSGVEGMIAHNLSMHFGQMKGVAALHTNAVSSVRFTMNPSKSYAEISNVFTSGDIVEADCNNAGVWLRNANTEEGKPAPQLGALGNDWDDFVLVKGKNIINAEWSGWVNPDYKPILKIMYNEVFL